MGTLSTVPSENSMAVCHAMLQVEHPQRIGQPTFFDGFDRTGPTTILISAITDKTPAPILKPTRYRTSKVNTPLDHAQSPATTEVTDSPQITNHHMMFAVDFRSPQYAPHPSRTPLSQLPPE